MKVAISSASFGAALASGDLTQLEWLERCASALGADGVVFAREHFARTDDEYAAQLRKIAVDLGLVVVALDDERLLDEQTTDEGRAATLELAASVGALFVTTILPAPGPVPPATFVGAVAAAKSAAKRAKAHNVTLLVRPAADSLGPDAPALRHFAKDVDSAWWRYAFAATDDRTGLSARDRVLLVTIGETDDLDAVADLDDAARPWFLLDGPVDAHRVLGVRRAAARKTLAETTVS